MSQGYIGATVCPHQFKVQDGSLRKGYCRYRLLTRMGRWKVTLEFHLAWAEIPENPFKRAHIPKEVPSLCSLEFPLTFNVRAPDPYK